jgi:hypothetical protein
MFDLVLRLIERGKFDPGLIFLHEMSFQRDLVKSYDMACNYKDDVGWREDFVNPFPLLGHRKNN